MESKINYILAKVSELFQRYGIRSITMDDVAREVGISKKTLYQHIDHKDELVEKVVEAEGAHRRNIFFNILQNQKLNAVDELFEVNKLVGEMLKNYNPAIEYDLRKYYPQLYQKIKMRKRDKMYEAVKENISKGKKQGLYRKEVNEEIIAKLYVSRVENVCENDIFTDAEYKAPEFSTEIIIYHIRGIANEKGIAYLEENLQKLKKEKDEDR
jgi:AcrR family transcriptional regulator